MPRFWEDYNILINTHHQELMKSVGSHGGLLLLIMMKVMETSVGDIMSIRERDKGPMMVATGFALSLPNWAHS
jgi:hypothetical protein